MSTLRLTDLDAAAKDVQMAQRAAMVAEVHATPGQSDTPQEAAVYAKQAIESCVNALQRLENMGAQLVGITGMPAPTVPLDLLNTCATRHLLTCLEMAAHAAEAVDRERGSVDASGDCVGYAETIGGMALGLRTEIYGPVDLRQE